MDINNSCLYQTTNSVLMVKPVDFQFNIETAQDNKFMKFDELEDKDYVQRKVIQEYEDCVKTLRDNGINVVSFDKNNYPQLSHLELPDQVFPNNHFSTWQQGSITTYPMKNPSREKEKLTHQCIFQLLKNCGFTIERIESIERESECDALESTGSLVLDRVNKIVYASLSQRTSQNLVLKWAQKYDYQSILFKSYDKDNNEIYHTNIMLSIGSKFAVVCLEVIDSVNRQKVLESLQKHRQVIVITIDQCLNGYAGNCLELRNKENESLLIMSQKAKNILIPEQLLQIQKQCKIIEFRIDFIEKIGGGSARCMIAEIFNENIY